MRMDLMVSGVMLVAMAAVLALGAAPLLAAGAAVPEGAPVRKIVRTDAEWRKLLTPAQYHVLREKGTDLAFTGPYVHVKGRGVFQCAACGLDLFSTDQKFDSGTGWPSFWAPIAKSHVVELPDHSLGMERIALECARCGGHLGHVFDDGPPPTGLRYCINSTSLRFVPSK